MSEFTTIVTTIFEPSECLLKLSSSISEFNGDLIIIGDRKTPNSFKLNEALYYSIDDQNKLEFELVKQIKENHYARKNLGYLIAIKNGAQLIYETDDDNAPDTNWKVYKKNVQVNKILSSGWVNVYKFFSNDIIWPRGFPLDLIHGDNNLISKDLVEVEAPIQQCLANISPDVDAIWRLVFNKEFLFIKGNSIYLPAGSWCPFNSQATWWWKEAFPLLYLPSNCSFRMTDIWRSFIAQRCLWEEGLGIVFHQADVKQNRNIHTLMKDFQDEYSGYLNNKNFVDTLSKVNLKKNNMLENLMLCYEAIVKNGFIPKEELNLVNAWINDINNFTH